MAIQVNPIASPRIITIPEVDGNSITIQSLVNQIRAWEDDQANLSYARLLSASGKEDLGGGALVGITAKLENAKVKFAARGSPTVCTISGGNIVAVDANGDSMSPIEPSTNVSVVVSQSSSPTMIAEWTQAEKTEQITTTQAIKGKTDNLPLSPADQILLDGQEATSLERLNEILTKLGVTTKGGFSI